MERSSRGGWVITDEEAAVVRALQGEPRPRVFRGYRPQPPAEYAEKGITNSGASHDYEGVVFSDGTVVIRWMTEYRSHSVWLCWDDFIKVHGHPEYGTSIVFQDEEGGQ